MSYRQTSELVKVCKSEQTLSSNRDRLLHQSEIIQECQYFIKQETRNDNRKEC